MLDQQNFAIEFETFDGTKLSSEFLWGNPSPLFSFLYPLIDNNVIELSDLLLIEPAVDNLAFGLIEELKIVKNRSLSKGLFFSLSCVPIIDNIFYRGYCNITIINF